VARAKRTDRADARRRYRAVLAQQTESDEPPVEPGVSGASEAQEQQPRRGIRYAFSASFRPLDLRGDLAALPMLVRTRALLIPLAILVVTAVTWAIAESSLPPIGTDAGAGASALVLVAFFGFQYFVMTPPIGGAFLGGFLSPRGSWLIGWIIGLVAGVSVAILATVAPSSIDRVVGTSDATRTAYAAQGLLVSPVACAVFAAAAAWYKRFLELANPNRRRQQAANRPRPRPRSGQRPFLSRANARRR